MPPQIVRSKADGPFEVELKTQIDVETHKRFVKYCAERRTTRAEVMRVLIERLLQENDDEKK